jgi:hypothetical protein
MKRLFTFSNQVPRKGAMAIASKILRSITTAPILLGASLAIGCSEKCAFIRNSGPSQPTAVTKVQPRPATWPPASESVTPSKTITPTVSPKVETASAPTVPVENLNPTAAIQPVGAQIPPPAPVSDSGPSGVVQAQRLETVPAIKKVGPNQTITPTSNPDMASLPLIPTSSTAPGSTLVVPPPPPGSPLNSSAPLGIPSAPTGAPSR